MRADKKRRPVVTGQTHERRQLHQMTPEEIARAPHAETLGIRRHDMAKLSPSQVRAISEASNRTRRRTEDSRILLRSHALKEGD